MRGILVDWLIEVHTKFRLLPETIFLMSNLIDRFLSLRVVSLVKFQLVGITALFVAAKYEEVVCPSVTNFVYMTEDGYEAEEMLSAERYLLRMVDFNLSYPNPLNFLRRISKADKYDIQSRTFAKVPLFPLTSPPLRSVLTMRRAVLYGDCHRRTPPPALSPFARRRRGHLARPKGPQPRRLGRQPGPLQRLQPARDPAHRPGHARLLHPHRRRRGTRARQLPQEVLVEKGPAPFPSPSSNDGAHRPAMQFYRCSEIVREWVEGRYVEETATGHDFFRLEEWEA